MLAIFSSHGLILATVDTPPCPALFPDVLGLVLIAAAVALDTVLILADALFQVFLTDLGA